MKFYFELRKDKADKKGLVPIRLVVTNNKVRIRKSIDAKTRLQDWDNESFYIKNSMDNSFYQEYKDFNKTINSTKEKVEGIFAYFRYNKIPFSKDVFLKKFEVGEVKVAMSFFDAYDEYIEVSKLTKTNSTIIKIRSVKNFLISFKEYSSFDLRLDNINFRFEEAFMDYSFNHRKTLNNYYAKIVKTLKAFLNWAFERGYHNSTDFKKIKSKEDDIEVIYLTIDELKKLYHHDFKNPAKNRAKDMFCFLAYTGQRFIDVYRLCNANLEGEYLNFTVKKTKTVNHRVYLIKQARELINKYKDTMYYPIPRISSQKLNEKIQECCEEVGITQEVVLTRYIGAREISQKFKKYELISSHVGRRSFITNSLVLGIPERVVRSISNHKDEKSFRKYVNISELHKQKELEKWDSVF